MKAPANLPKVGTTIHDARFGGGCTIRVKRLLPPSGDRGWRVVVHLTADDGHSMENRGRSWGLATWLDTVSRADREPQGGNG